MSLNKAFYKRGDELLAKVKYPLAKEFEDILKLKAGVEILLLGDGFNDKTLQIMISSGNLDNTKILKFDGACSISKQMILSVSELPYLKTVVLDFGASLREHPHSELAQQLKDKNPSLSVRLYD